MSASADSTARGEAPRLRAFDAWLARVETSLNLLAALFIFGLMFLGMAQVLGRRLFNAPMTGYIDFVELSIATFAFLGAAYCQRLGDHVRMDMLIRKAPGRLRWTLEIAGTVIALFVIAVLIWYGFEHFLRAYQLGDSTIDAEIPVWPSKLVVPVAFTVLWLRLLLQLAGYARLWWNPRAEQIAIPPTLTTEELAAREIEESAGG